MRFDDWKEYICNPPEFRKGTDMGDITMMLYFGSMGKTAYVNRVMSCYRRGGVSSFSTDRNSWSEERRIIHFEKQLKVWSLFDEYTNTKYHDICVQKISDMMFGYCVLCENASALLNKENSDYFAKLTFFKRIYIVIACVLKKTMKKNYIRTMQRREEKTQSYWENT